MSKKKTPTASKTRNIVQCFSLQINRAATFVDRKKAQKRGHSKYRLNLLG